ncbi:MAG: efflux RND transporter permease subunit [Gemmatimonadales bacterium]|nr:efflux RND transporter permease subunit [Gemmatimonadales bacterium]
MIRWATTRPAVIWAFGVALILAGGLAFGRLPLATKTSVELPRLTVSASWSGASAELLETYLTSPIEAAIQGVRGVRKTTSTSSDRGTSIRVDLEANADVQLTRLAIHERLQLLRSDSVFPQGASMPSVSNYVPEELDEPSLLQYRLSGPYTPGTLSRLAREQLSPRLTSVEGVSNVTSFGVAELGVAVSYDVQRLRQLDISPALLSAALAGARMVQALGEERLGSTVRTVVLRDQPKAYQDLEALPIRAPNGRIFRLGELASVRPEEDAQGRFARLNGTTAVGLDITRLPGADVIHTARKVKAAVQELSSVLPPGVTMRLENDESVDLSKQLNDLILRGSIAFAAVTLVLLIGMRRIRPVALVMGSAAIAIAGTALGLYLFKIPANLLTLAGLGMGIGILVQDGVVVVDRLRRVPNTPAARAAAGNRISRAVIGSTLTTIVVLFPFLYLQGNARAAFVPFAAAFALGLVWSVFSSVVMIPSVGTGGSEKAPWPKLQSFYLKTLSPLLRWRKTTLAFTILLLGVVTWGFVKRVPRSSFGNWYGQRTTLGVTLSFPRGSDPESLDRSIAEFERIAVGREGVERVEARGGGSSARLEVTFKDEYALSPIPLQMQEEMTQRAVLVGGASVYVSGRGPGFANGGGSSSVTFRIKLLGYSFGGVERLAKDLRDRLERIPRVRSVNINAGSFWGAERAVSVVLTPDRGALARAGVSARDFAGTLAREIRGAVGGQRLEFDGEETSVSLKAAGARERSLDELRSVLVPNGTRSPVRVGDLAEVGEREGLGTISREDQQYVRIVAYDFRGPQKLANRTHEAFMKSISAPAGYSISDQRFTWEEDNSAKGLWFVFAAGVILVVLSVAMVFDSVWAAAMVFLSLPVAVAGVAAVFWATKTSFTREAAVGVILVVGLAVHQAILLVDAALERRRELGRLAGEASAGGITGFERPSGKLTVDDVLHAAADRAGMIVLVTLTTLASLIPLAVGADGDSLFSAIALATAGGTVAGTIGALWIVPTYLVSWKKRRSAAAAARPEGSEVSAT